MFSPSANPTCATVRWSPSSVEQLHCDLLEPKCLRDRGAHLGEQRSRVRCLVQRRRDGEQPFECVAVRLRTRAFLRGLHGERCVLGDGDEDVDLVAARPAARERLVDGEDAEQLAVRPTHRHEQRVVRMPRGRVVAETARSGVYVVPPTASQSNSPAGMKYAPRCRKRASSSGSHSDGG